MAPFTTTDFARSKPRRFTAFLLVVSCLPAFAGLRSGWAVEPPRAATEFDDVPELLVPRKPRSESEEDLLNSAAHFAQARLFLQRRNHEGALRHFQRAWRFNPDQVDLLDRVVALASELGRNEVAARYAIIAAERRPQDPRLMVSLGGLLGQQDETARSLEMYARAIELWRGDKVTPQQVAVRIEMGRLYFLTGDFKNASLAFAKVLEALDDPQVLNDKQRKVLLAKPHPLYSLIAASFEEDGQFDQAIEMYRKADSFKPNAAELDFRLAGVALRQKKYDEARQLLNRYLDAKSTSGGVEPYRLLEKLIQHEEASPQAAEAAFLQSLRSRQEADQDNVPLSFFLAGELLAKDELAAAETLYVRLLKKRATADAYKALAEIYRRQDNVPALLDILEQVVFKTESLQVVEDEVKRVNENQELITKLLEASREKCKSESKKVRFTAALAAAHLAIEAGKLEDYDTFAEIAFQAAGDKRIQVLEQLGLSVFIAEDASRAARSFQKALEEKPDQQTAGTLNFYLAGALQFAGDTDAALLAAAKAAELRSDSPRFVSRKPWILYQAKRFELAEQQYLKLLDEFGSNYVVPGARDVVRETYLILSNMAAERQQYAQAEDWLALVLDEFPEDVGAMNDLGYLWADQGVHLQRALRMIKRAVDAEPDNIAYRDSLGWVYYRLGQFANAVRELKIATAGESPDGVILNHLGDALASESQAEQAVAAWKKALDAFQKAEQVDKLAAIKAKIKKYSKD